MKRGGPRHPKTIEFSELLGIRRAHAVGILELLFHFAAEFAPAGDVGKFTDKRIAAALDWGGAPDKLISAMVEARWLERHPTARLLVHDWDEHADRTTVQRLTRSGKTTVKSNQSVRDFLCTQHETSGINVVTLPLPLPEPLPEPEPTPQPTALAIVPASPPTRFAFERDESFTEFAQLANEFWHELIPEDLQQCWLFCWKKFDPDQKREATAILRLRIEYGEDSRYVKRPPKYLDNGEWKRKPRPPTADRAPVSKLDQILKKSLEKYPD